MAKNPIVTFETTAGTITAELYPEIAPNTVNGVENDLKHTAGVLSMARSMMPDSAGSQFFIMHKDAPHLDGQYAAFGKVTDGMDTVNSIAETETDYSDAPLEPQMIIKVTVDTDGVEYPEPEKC